MLLGDEEGVKIPEASLDIAKKSVVVRTEVGTSLTDSLASPQSPFQRRSVGTRAVLCSL